jgi:hypothetical protein
MIRGMRPDTNRKTVPHNRSAVKHLHNRHNQASTVKIIATDRKKTCRPNRPAGSNFRLTNQTQSVFSGGFSTIGTLGLGSADDQLASHEVLVVKNVHRPSGLVN